MKDKIIDEMITVELLGSGYAAVHRVLVRDPKLGDYWDIQQTGIGRYRDRLEAVNEAKDWAMSDEIRLDPSVL